MELKASNVVGKRVLCICTGDSAGSYCEGANLMCILSKGSINTNSTFQTWLCVSYIFINIIAFREIHYERLLRWFLTISWRVCVCVKFSQWGLRVLTVSCLITAFTEASLSMWLPVLSTDEPHIKETRTNGVYVKTRQRDDWLISCRIGATILQLRLKIGVWMNRR